MSFKKYLETRDNLPETDEEAKIRLPQDVRLQAMYDQLRKTGKSPGEAWNHVIQAQWQAKKAMS